MKSSKKFGYRLAALMLSLLCVISTSGNAYAIGTIPGDIDGNGVVNVDDAVYLLLHVMFGEEFYPLNSPAPNPPEDTDGEKKLVIGLCQNSKVLNYEDNYLTKLLEEKTGVDIEFMFFAPNPADARKQLRLMVVGEEKLPDILVGILDDELRSELGNKGLLVDCTPYLKDLELFYYGSQYLAVASWPEKNLFWNRFKDPISGAIYGYPSLEHNDGAVSLGYMGGINATFAEKFGMKAEEIDTVEEVYQYLTKVVNDDPNGNGKKDELGILYFPYGDNSGNIEQWVVNAYVYWNEASFFNVTDGIVWEPYSTVGFRQAYIELNKWYKEGLISDLSFCIATAGEMKALVDNPDNYTIGIFGGNPANVCATNSKIGEEYTNLQVLDKKTHMGGAAVLDGNDYIATMNVSITSDCKNPRLAFKFLDHNNNPALGPVFRYGAEGVNWAKVDGKVTLDSGETIEAFDDMCHPAGYRVVVDEWSTTTVSTWHQLINTMWVKAGYDNGLSCNPGYGGRAINLNKGSREELIWSAIAEMRSGPEPAEKFIDIPYNVEEIEVVIDTQRFLIDTLNTWRVYFITGIKDPNNDNHWGEFIDELGEKGLYDWLDVAQDAYSRATGF